MTRRVLVTGAAGFVGSHLRSRLRAADAVRITGFDRRTPAPGLWDTFVEGDVASREAVFGVVRDTRPDEIFHLAGITRGSDADLEAVNFMGTRHLLEAVAAHRPDAAVIVVGSAAEYGATAAVRSPLTEEDHCAPVGSYGRTKHSAVRATLSAAAIGLRANVVRPFNLVGAGVPESLVVGAVVARMRAVAADGGREIRVGDVDSLRDFVDVGDAVDGMVALARSGLTGRVFNLCSGAPRSIREVVLQVARIADVDVQIVQDPALCRAGDVAVSVGSHAAATAAFGFRPTTPFPDSIRAAWEGCGAAVVSV